MTLSAERKVNSKYVEAVTKEEQAKENEVCVIINGVAQWVAPENVLINGKPLGDELGKIEKLVEAYNALFDEIRVINGQVEKCQSDITFIMEHSEL